MFAGQAERRVAGMIERGVEPPGGLVTVTTLGAATAFMRIITLVAAVAGRRRFHKRMVGVTIKAGSLVVFTDEAKPGRVMVERNLDPADRRMTVPTRLTHRLTVNIVIFMTGKTLGRGVAMLVPGLMAVTAGEFCVFAVQWEVSSLVFERRLIERHDVRVSAFVVDMAE